MAGAGAGACGMQICGCSQERREARPRGPGTPPHSSLAREGLLASSVDRCFSQPRRGAPSPEDGGVWRGCQDSSVECLEFSQRCDDLEHYRGWAHVRPESPENVLDGSWEQKPSVFLRR